MAAASIARVSSDDLMLLATDRGTKPMQVGVVLMLATGLRSDPTALIAAFERRLPAIPQLRQKLVRVMAGCGRPIWIDDSNFRVADHISVLECPPPGGIDGVLVAAADLLTTRLPRHRALWAASIVTGVGGGRTALIVVFHHVLADGVAGIAMLAELSKKTASPRDDDFPRAAPTRLQLAVDAARDRLIGVKNLPTNLVRGGGALFQVRAALHRVSRTSLNRPTGPHVRFETISRDLRAVREAAHANQVTVNDVVLSAITGALHRLLAWRGEHAEEFVISVPFSARRRTTAQSLGNDSAAVPLRLPATGKPLDRLRAVSAVTSAAKLSPRGASASVLGPAFRLLARIGLYQWFIDHQRSVHTFATNVTGPQAALSFGDSPIVDIIPLTVVVGNVTVSFAVLSYAGKLTVTLIADPETCPDLDGLRTALAEELDALHQVTAVG